MSDRQALIEKFLSKEVDSYERHPFSGDASFRNYERITFNEQSRILMDAPPEKESVERFVEVDEFLGSKGLNPPTIYSKDIENGLLLLEDFGDRTFSKSITKENESELYKSAIDVLLKLHKLEPANFLSHHKDRMIDEVLRFTEWFAPMETEITNSQIAEFKDIWIGLIEKHGFLSDVVCLYDYHADNLMWLPEREGTDRVGLLDFQDAVIGSPALDLAALLQDIRRDVSEDVKEEMFSYFLSNSSYDTNDFISQYNLWGAHWNTRILGTFARLAKRDKKVSYLNYIPTVWKRLEENLVSEELSELKNWFDQIIPSEKRYAA